MQDYEMLVLPGGFSYGDNLGAGTLWALDLRYRILDDINAFVEAGRPVIGICNGFQVLVKAGILPALATDETRHRLVTLAPNESGHFECRWVYLLPNSDCQCPFVSELEGLIYCPVAHGEGRIAFYDKSAESAVQAHNLIALTYVDASGHAADYPDNPNGSAQGIAGLCNTAGNVLGLMPHPENHIFHWQHPRWSRGESGHLGLELFRNAVKFA